MARANFTFEVQEMQGRTCIIITDLNQGQMSVTNDIENVVAEICKERELNAEDCVVVYKDSEGQWDGWDAKDNHFVSLGKQHWAHAVNSYLKKQRQAPEVREGLW